MSRALLAIALVAALAVPARAGVWDDAASGGGDASALVEDAYQAGLRTADEAAALVRQDDQPFRQVQAEIDRAIVAYQAAAKVKPTEAEPYARIAKLIYSFYFERCVDPIVVARLRAQGQMIDVSPYCDPFNAARAKQLIAAWDALEARAPLDPRVADMLFERAILNTKLASHDSLLAAARDYRTLLTLRLDVPNTTVINNLAETYMMLGDLENAIAMYRRAVAASADDWDAFGLAVALDRDGQGVEAKNLILELGQQTAGKFYGKIRDREIFFVPEGEVFYYYALVEEAFGDADGAAIMWQRYLDSGAHPQYQPRAREHLVGLRAQLKVTPKILRKPPADPLDE